MTPACFRATQKSVFAERRPAKAVRLLSQSRYLHALREMPVDKTSGDKGKKPTPEEEAAKKAAVQLAQQVKKDHRKLKAKAAAKKFEEELPKVTPLIPRFRLTFLCLATAARPEGVRTSCARMAGEGMGGRVQTAASGAPGQSAAVARRNSQRAEGDKGK